MTFLPGCGILQFTPRTTRRVTTVCEVFPTGSLAAAQMPLALVLLKDGLNLVVERVVDMWQSLGHVLVNRALADAELCGGCPHRGAVFDDVMGKRDATLAVGCSVHDSISPLCGNASMKFGCRFTETYARECANIHATRQILAVRRRKDLL